MAAKEPYDYLTTIMPDYSTTTLSVDAQKVMFEEGQKNIIIHTADDDSEERIALSIDTIWYARIQWDALSEADAGTILDFYHDTAKACGTLYSFKWAHPTDGHTYVVRFAGPLQRLKHLGDIWGIAQIRLRILGRIAD